MDGKGIAGFDDGWARVAGRVRDGGRKRENRALNSTFAAAENGWLWGGKLAVRREEGIVGRWGGRGLLRGMRTGNGGGRH